MCYFCSEYFSFAVFMPQSVCVCASVPTSDPLLMYEHQAQVLGLFGGSLPERHSQIRTVLCCKTSGSAMMLKGANLDSIKFFAPLHHSSD